MRMISRYFCLLGNWNICFKGKNKIRPTTFTLSNALAITQRYGAWMRWKVDGYYNSNLSDQICSILSALFFIFFFVKREPRGEGCPPLISFIPFCFFLFCLFEAYIFRPNGTFPLTSEGQIPLTVVRGPLLDEVHQRINSWIYQITRVYKEKERAEVEFTVGPIPIDDGVGKEIVTKVTTALKSNKTFYTDSSGRDFIERIRDYRADWDLEVNQPVAGNYYPISLGIYMKDDSKEFSILVDRSVGGSSIVDGQLELMLHRRLLHDDSRGVAEALNETVCVHDECTGLTIQGKYYLRIDPLGEGAKWRRSFGQEIYSPFLLAFTEQDGDKWTNFPVPSFFSGMDPSYSLPDNIAMITLEELEDGKVLLRLAHLYELPK